MSVDLTLLFVEKQVEAVRLCAALTEPYATGTVPIKPDALSKEYSFIAGKLQSSLNELKALSETIEADAKKMEPGDLRNARQRIQTMVAEISRGAQDYAAQVRFYQAMNAGGAAAVKAGLDAFENVNRATRELVVEEDDDQPNEGSELAPAKDEEPADPTLM
ncbi:MAG: hypothetical protein IT462_00985 [Planctomycetes bacterium]|nr:hypothetical protein [Planctomycetota bacterium]